MKNHYWMVLVGAIALVGCETTTRTSTEYATNDSIEVSEDEFNAIQAAQARLTLGLKYLKKGYMGRAKQNLVKAYNHKPDMPDVLFGLAYYYQQVYEFETADKYYRMALDESPDNPDYLNAYGAFLCGSKNEYSRGVEYFLEAIDQPGYTSVAEAYENAGFCSIDDKKIAQAEEYFEKALIINPNLTRSMYGLAQVYYAQGSPRRAADYLYRYEGRPGTPSAGALLLGFKAAKATNNRGRMRSYGEKLMQLYPRSTEATEYLNLR